MGCIKEADGSDYRATIQTNPSQAQANQDSTGDPVNVVTGAFTLSECDVSFPVQRLQLELTRHYNNQLHDSDLTLPPGPFGRGWSHSLGLRINTSLECPDVEYIDDRGTTIVFECDSTSGTFVAPPGSLGLQLSRPTDSGYRLRQMDGLTADFCLLYTSPSPRD